MTDLAGIQLGQVGDATITGDYQGQSTRKHFEFRFTYSRASVAGSTTWIAVPFYRGPERWHPTVYNLPLQMSTLKKPGTPETRRRLYDLCLKHGVTGFVRPYDKLTTSVKRMGEYLKGERDYATVSSFARLD